MPNSTFCIRSSPHTERSRVEWRSSPSRAFWQSEEQLKQQATRNKMLNEDVHGRAAPNRFVNHMTNGDSKKPDIDHIGKWHEQLNDSVRTTCEVSLSKLTFWLTNSISWCRVCDISWVRQAVRYTPNAPATSEQCKIEVERKDERRLLFYNPKKTHTAENERESD